MPWQTLAPGQNWRGHWNPNLDGFSPLPVLAMRGAQDGPTLLITGAVHGDEYEGPIAIRTFFHQLDSTQLRGRVIGLPVINTAAWAARVRVTPRDGGDLNRVFPGVADSPETPTVALAHAVFDTLVRACDVLIDLHSGGAKLMHLPMIGWYAGGAEAERLARGFGADFYPWQMFDRAGVLSREAHCAGKVALGAEWGGGARLDPVGATAYAAGLHRVLAALEMVPSQEEVVRDERPPIIGSYQATDAGGLFVPHVALGDSVPSGARLGVLYDELGAVTGYVVTERAGIVAALPHLPLVEAGDRVAYIG